MKPIGPIPPYFGEKDGWLLIGGKSAEAHIEDMGGTPLFVYDFAIVRDRIAAVRAAMPKSLSLHYAMKANPLPNLVKAIVPLVDGIDIASNGELDVALSAGAKTISFAGPGKRDEELRAALLASVTINLESEGEAKRALRIADSLGIPAKLAVRVNPGFGLKGSGLHMSGGAKPFGIDAERVPALVRQIIGAGAQWQGFHIFAGSQSLNTEAIAEAQAATISLAARLAEDIGVTPALVNLGGGFGVPYSHGETSLDLNSIGGSLQSALDQRPAILAESRFALELGRYLVAEAGVYLTRIVDRKLSHGQIFLIVDGGLHHQLAASGQFGMVVRRNYPVAIASHYLRPAEEVATICGCLCTPLDRLADAIALPHADEGDIVAVFLAGAYGASASPAAFLGHGPAQERLIGV